MKNILMSVVEKKINELHADRKSLIVLKGVPLPGDFRPDLCEIASNKLMYFFNAILRAERRLISYEEFLMLQSFYHGSV